MIPIKLFPTTPRQDAITLFRLANYAAQISKGEIEAVGTGVRHKISKFSLSDTQEIIENIATILKGGDVVRAAERLLVEEMTQHLPTAKPSATAESERRYTADLDKLKTEFALIEGTARAYHIKQGTEYSKTALFAHFCPDAVRRWLNWGGAPVITQKEVNRAKQDTNQKAVEETMEQKDA